MGLLEDLQNKEVEQSPCRFRSVFDTLSGEEQQALKNAVDNIQNDERLGKSKHYSATWLSEVLTSNGYQISRSSIARHLKGACSCEHPL